MSFGLFIVGFITGFFVFLISLCVYITKPDFQKTCLCGMFVGVMFFTVFFVLSFMFPNGFVELKHALAGNEFITMRINTTQEYKLSDNDQAQLNELKRNGFEILTSEDGYDGLYSNNNGNIICHYYRDIKMIRRKNVNTISKQYENLMNGN